MQSIKLQMNSRVVPRLLVLVVAAIGVSLWLSGTELSTASDNTRDTRRLPYLAVAKGRLDIQGGLTRIAAARDGVIQKVLVEEGNTVKAGQALAILNKQQSQLDADIARAELAQARQALPIFLLKRKATQREITRITPLIADKIVSQQELDQQNDALSLIDAETQSAHAAIAMAEQRVRMADFEVEQRIIRAPADGQIVKRMVRQGDVISTQTPTPLFLFAPKASRVVIAELEERFVPDIKPGQAAEVVLEADTTRKFSAQVQRLGLIIGVRTPTADPLEKQDERVVECILSIDAPDLLIGQRVIVRFLKPA